MGEPEHKVFHDHHLNHRMPRVLYVIGQKPGDDDDNAVFTKVLLMFNAIDCICTRFVAQKFDWIAPAANRGKPNDEYAATAIRKAQTDGNPYDFIIADSLEVAADVKRAVNLLGDGDHKPPVLICTHTDAEAIELRKQGQHAFSSLEMIGETKTAPNEFDKQVTLALGEAGIKRLECDRAESVQVAWGKCSTSANELEEDGSRARIPDRR